MQAAAIQWLKALDKRAAEGRLRQLREPQQGIDFYSNDYLGMSRDGAFQQKLADLVQKRPGYLGGATGSRLISGNTIVKLETEAFIAQEHQVESALLLPSGYKANLALFSCIAQRGDTIICDEQIHRSVHDGCKLSHARQWKFRHNDLEHLEALIQKSKGNVFIAIESLYSMDGDFAPLDKIVALAQQYGAGLIVDEAHALGVFGYGLLAQQHLQEAVLATVVTYGKAFGLYGAAILGSKLLKDYLVNFASAFIYSSAMPDIQALSIQKAYEYLVKHPERAQQLQENINHFRCYGVHSLSSAGSPVQVVQFSEIQLLQAAYRKLREEDILTYALFPPTVASGTERLRICLHQFNSAAEIKQLCSHIKHFQS